MEVTGLKEPFIEFIKENLDTKTLLITCGLPASYKTEASKEVAKVKGYSIIRSDLVRLEVLKNEDIFNAKIAGNMKKRLSVYDEVFRRANALAEKKEIGIILDATFVTQEMRRRAAQIAVKHSLAFVIMQTSCPEELSLTIIRHRLKEKYESNALTEEAYLANKKSFEPVDLDDLKEMYPKLNVTHLIVDTCRDEKEKWYIISSEKR